MNLVVVVVAGASVSQSLWWPANNPPTPASLAAMSHSEPLSRPTIGY